MKYNFYSKRFNANDIIEFIKEYQVTNAQNQLSWINKNFISGNLYTFDIDKRIQLGYGDVCCLYFKSGNQNIRMELKPGANLLYLGTEIDPKIGYHVLVFLYDAKKCFLNICEAWGFKPVEFKQ